MPVAGSRKDHSGQFIVRCQALAQREGRRGGRGGRKEGRGERVGTNTGRYRRKAGGKHRRKTGGKRGAKRREKVGKKGVGRGKTANTLATLSNTLGEKSKDRRYVVSSK